MGTFEIVLIVTAAIMLIGVPLAVLAGLWLWQRGKRAPPAIRQSQGPDDRHTTLIDL
jgi:hypothetical protein